MMIDWLLHYLLHSTILIVSAAVLVRLRPFRDVAVQDLFWKTALLAGMVTASVQVGVGAHWNIELAPALASKVAPSVSPRPQSSLQNAFSPVAPVADQEPVRPLSTRSVKMPM